MVHTNCKICTKNTFYTLADFSKAHGQPRLEKYWIVKKSIINKKPLIFSYQTVCRICKKEKHLTSCRFYNPSQIPLTTPKVFDWDAYWKWWFGVNTLDWNSQRFFGKY